MKNKTFLFLFCALTIFVLFCIFFSPIALQTKRNPLSDVKIWFILLAYDPNQFDLDSVETSQFQMAILDPDSHPDLEHFRRDLIRIGYLSLGEAESYRFYWERIKNKAWLIGENPNWPENYFVDIRNQEWHALILNEVIPEIIKQGFDGLMLDTLDTAEFLESEGNGQYRGAYQAMIDLVKEIREKYPRLLLISNNGFSILKHIAPYLNAMLTEDIYMMPDFEKGGYIPVSPEDREFKIKTLNPLAEQYRLPVFNIEYVDINDVNNIKSCVMNSKNLGFRPYVSNKNLSEVYSLDYKSF